MEEKPLFTLENILNIKLPLSNSQKQYLYELNSCAIIQYSNIYGIMIMPLETSKIALKITKLATIQTNK